MATLITIIHVIVCLILIVAVLLQSGKSADLAGAFGGGGSQSVFGPRGATSLLSKVTTASAVIFMLTSMGLWIVSAKGAKSVVSGEEAPAVTETQQVPENDPNAAAAVPAEDPEKKAEVDKTAETEKKPGEEKPGENKS